MEEEIKLPEVAEPTITFKVITDRDQFLINNADTKETLVEISGYDLSIDFNMKHINSMEDVESAVGGLGEMFRKIILDKLLEHKNQHSD